MAKGFKVVSKPPTESKDAFDIEAAKQLLKVKVLYFVYLVEEYHTSS